MKGDLTWPFVLLSRANMTVPWSDMTLCAHRHHLEREGRPPFHQHGTVAATDRVYKLQVFFGGRCLRPDDHVAPASQGRCRHAYVSNRLDKAFPLQCSRSDDSQTYHHMAADSAGKVCTAQTDAPGVNQDADRVSQPKNISSGIGLNPSHADNLVQRIGGCRVVSKRAQLLSL